MLIFTTMLNRSEHDLRAGLFLLAVVLLVPFCFYAYIVTIWHWKRRYQGKRSELWGALLLLETTGWFKVIYWFRHILPDWYGSGRYSNPNS